MKSFLRIIILCLAAASAPALCFAGTAKTAGNFEILSDVINMAGQAGHASGNFSLYQSIGEILGNKTAEAGTYSLTGGFLGVVDETPPTVEFVTPTSGTTVGGTVDLVATAFDQNGAQWTVYYGPGAAPSRANEIASGTANVTASQVGAWNTSEIAGTYTASLVAVDSRGNVATATLSLSVVNTVAIAGVIPKQKWVLVSTPIQPAPADPVSMYGQNYDYKVYRWNPEKTPQQDSARYEFPANLSSGNGYWVKVYNQDMPYNYSGTLTDTTRDYVFSAKTGWNQIGAPFNRAFPWDEVRVRQNGNVYTLEAAAGMGLVSDTLTSYDYTAKSWVQNPPATDMETQKGYNVRVYDNVELLFSPDARAGGGAQRQLAKIIRQPFDYRIKISAVSSDSADLENYIGVTQTAAREFDRYDLEEPANAPSGNKYTSLYFPHSEWAARAARYANDVRAPVSAASGTEDWNMNVETNESGQKVTLTWDNSTLPVDTYTFTLINLDTGERIDMAAKNSYTFTAAAGDVSETHFRIEVARLAGGGLVTKKYTLKPGWNLVSIPIEPQVTNALAQLGKQLPMLNLYQFYDGQFYSAKEADIQAGIGYWIYVSENAEIGVEGLIPASVIRIPLKTGWNIIGNPYETELPWSDSNISVECGGASETLTQAVAAGDMTDVIFRFDGGNYIKQNAGSNIEPWKGYFMKAPKECTLVMKK